MPMPPIPAIVMLPNSRNDGYHPANVVAAIPLGHGNVYAVTAIAPTSSPDAPVFLVGEAGRTIHGFWVTDPDTYPVAVLADALSDMAGIARLTSR